MFVYFGGHLLGHDPHPLEKCIIYSVSCFLFIPALITPDLA